MSDGNSAFDQKKQQVGQQVNIGNMRGGKVHVGDIYITTGDEPPLFVGIPDFPRYGLIGRDDLLNDIITRLTSSGQTLLSALGKGGAGKTALAVAVARNRALLKHFSDGVLWASVGPKGDPLLELGRWAEALGVDTKAFPGSGPLKEALKNAIGQRKLLLVIDDTWKLTHAELLRCGGPNCAHLLTSRDNDIAIKFVGGRERAMNVPDLEEKPAFALLQTIAPEACQVNEAVARSLALQVGGLPLAVELLGGYLTKGGAPDPDLFPDLSQERLEDLGDATVRLRQAQTRLGSSTGGAVSLLEVIGLSLEMFSEEEQTAYYSLGAFAPQPAVFSRAAAEAVCGANGALLNRFINHNLLEISAGSFTLHQVLSDLARKRIDDKAQARHADYYLALVNEDRKNWQRIDGAYEQIRWAWDHPDYSAIVDWTWALRTFQEVRSLWREKIDWHKRGLEWARANKHRKYESSFLINLGWANRMSARLVTLPGRCKR